MKRGKYFEEFFLKKRNDISFITLKKGAVVSFKDKTYIAKATHTDVIRASAEAYINAANSIIVEQFVPTEV